MKKVIAVLFALTIAGMVVSAKAQEEEEKGNSFTDPNKAIQVTKKSEDVTLRVKSNPSTGYSWFLVKYDPLLLTPVSREFMPSEGAKPGTPGYEVWQFKVNSKAFQVPQITTIILQYIKPWVVPSNARQLKFTVVIEPKSLNAKPLTEPKK